ncbi:MAG: IPT/TIG domain-containing protein, partial [Dysgonamonadaceae bacterium]|nr:IPT/TIG domain-containing protein [Dysgonamonadaceae bacterium]
VLTEAEIQHNADLDQNRYLSPPKVTIGGKNCTEVVVLSPHFLMCKVPEGSSIGKKEVKVNGASYGAVYEYVDPNNDFYISGISPIVGPANTGNRTLTLSGNLLKTITEVKVDNIVCTNLVTNNSTATCILPPHPAGEVDITITAGSETYRFVKVFEYQ